MKKVLLIVLAIAALFSFAVPQVGAHADTACVFTGPHYARVAPFPQTSKDWTIYVPNFPHWPPHEPYSYPATTFPQRILNLTSWTHDTEYIQLSPTVMAAMAKLNGSMWNYLHNASDGTFFNGNKLGVDTFPGNMLWIINMKYRAGACWDEIATIPYNPNNAANILNATDAYLGRQTNMKYTTWPLVTVNGAEYIPLLYKGDGLKISGSDPGSLWIEDQYLAHFPTLPIDAVATTALYVRTQPDFNSSSLEILQPGASMTVTAYVPNAYRTYAKIHDPVGNKDGYVTLVYSLGYTTTWNMGTLPVPVP